MDRSKIVAVVTGAIALLLGIAYLIVVQFLDFRGEMLPAPVSQSAVIVIARMAAPMAAPMIQGAIDLG